MKHPARLAAAAAVGLLVSACATVPAGLAGRDFPVTVDYGRPLDDLVRAGGYGWVYSEVNSANFPASRSGQSELVVRLVPLDYVVSVDALVSREEADGWKAAGLQELLTFGQAYPELLRHASVVAFASHRSYSTISYINFGMGPAHQWTVISSQDFYPTLTNGLFGRSVVLMPEDQIPNYDPSGFYACFVRDAAGTNSTVTNP